MYVRFEVFTAVAMKNDVFWDVTQCSHTASLPRRRHSSRINLVHKKK
jgi:hypothetical protein